MGLPWDHDLCVFCAGEKACRQNYEPTKDRMEGSLRTWLTPTLRASPRLVHRKPGPPGESGSFSLSAIFLFVFRPLMFSQPVCISIIPPSLSFNQPFLPSFLSAARWRCVAATRQTLRRLIGSLVAGAERTARSHLNWMSLSPLIPPLWNPPFGNPRRQKALCVIAVYQPSLPRRPPQGNGGRVGGLPLCLLIWVLKRVVLAKSLLKSHCWRGPVAKRWRGLQQRGRGVSATPWDAICPQGKGMGERSRVCLCLRTTTENLRLV